MTDEQKCLEWLKHRRDNMPMAGAKRMFGIAISALEKQTVYRGCEICKYKDSSSWEEPCVGCYLAYNLEDRYEAEEES